MKACVGWTSGRDERLDARDSCREVALENGGLGGGVGGVVFSTVQMLVGMLKSGCTSSMCATGLDGAEDGLSTVCGEMAEIESMPANQ